MDSTLILSIVLEALIFLIASYFIFYKKFLEELGKQTAELTIIRKKTKEIEQVKSDFNKDLESFKKSLEFDFSKEIEPLKTNLSIIAFKQNEIFSIEKECLFEFNNCLNKWLWGTMGFDLLELTLLTPDQIIEKRKVINQAYNDTQVAYNAFSLIVDDDNLLKVGNEAILKTLKLKHFIEEQLSTLHLNKTWDKNMRESFLEYFKNPKNRSPTMDSYYLNLEKDTKAKIKKAADTYASSFMGVFKPSKQKIEEFKTLARKYVKSNQISEKNISPFMNSRCNK
jgi:hypothetical protein